MTKNYLQQQHFAEDIFLSSNKFPSSSIIRSLGHLTFMLLRGMSSPIGAATDEDDNELTDSNAGTDDCEASLLLSLLSACNHSNNKSSLFTVESSSLCSLHGPLHRPMAFTFKSHYRVDIGIASAAPPSRGHD